MKIGEGSAFSCQYNEVEAEIIFSWNYPLGQNWFKHQEQISSFLSLWGLGCLHSYCFNILLLRSHLGMEGVCKDFLAAILILGFNSLNKMNEPSSKTF